MKQPAQQTRAEEPDTRKVTRLALEQRFKKSLEQHPQIYGRFRVECLRLLEAGIPVFSARMVLEYIRYMALLEGQKFEFNNDFQSRFTRKLIGEDQRFKVVFKTRRLRVNREPKT